MRFPAAKLRKDKDFNPINPGNVDFMSLIPNAECPMPPVPSAQCPMPLLVPHPKLLLPPPPAGGWFPKFALKTCSTDT